MNIKHYLSAVAALGLLAACSEYDPGMSDQAIDLTDAEIETIEEYRANFIARYGEPAEGHTWGFGAKGSEDEMGTRASEPRSNEWVKVIKGKGQKKNANGEPLYYDSQNGNTETTVSGVWMDWGPQGMHWVDFTPVPLYDGDVPIAFEKHTGAVAIPGFPVQNYYLSSDYKTSETVQYEGTQLPENRQGWYHFRFANSNKEEWFPSEESILQYMRDNNINDGIIPLGDVASCNTLTDAEVADVYAEFSKEWHGTNPKIDLQSYFVQQIWKGTAEYTYTNQGGSTGTVVGGDKMDYLVAYGENYSAGDAEHFYNFNGSNFSSGSGGMMLIYDSNTKNFAFHNSWMAENTAATMWDHFRLVELHGNYYVGFDFESIGEYDKNIPRDHIYNDWIVKIIPGEGTIENPGHKWHRIMCEDLGSTDDYDFNDLVYDVYFTGTNDQYTAHIKVLASGGTLPIYVGTHTEDPKREAHQLLQSGNAKKLNGGKLYQPVNVSAGVTADPVEFEFEMKDASGNWLKGAAGTDPDYIPILVTSTDPSRLASGKNTFVLPTVKADPVPQKICIDGNLIDATKVRWMKERKQIESTYTLFDKWVGAGDKGNSDYHFGKPSDWTSHGLANLGNLQ
ncbi:MAG: hypothetical protein MR893_05620 [Prevotellaceae bacterium]|nr:hypothetical protein [Prevotellaceae bacterium]